MRDMGSWDHGNYGNYGKTKTMETEQSNGNALRFEFLNLTYMALWRVFLSFSFSFFFLEAGVLVEIGMKKAV